MLRTAAFALAVSSALVCSTAVAQSGGMFDLAKFRTLKVTIPSASWWQTLVNNKAQEIYTKADLEIDGVKFKSVGIRARGASAFGAARRIPNGKLPLKISFDEFVPNRRFLGRRAMDLNNGYWTPTFMREVLILHTMQPYIKAPRANFVKVVVNGVNYGVYVNVERPNKDFVRDRYFDDDGNRYHGRSSLTYRGNSPSFYKTSFPLQSTPRPDSYWDLIGATRATTYSGNQAFVEIPKHWNVDLALKVQALNSAMNNRDAFPRHNYYLYMDPYHKQMESIPWDTNLSLRSSTFLSAPQYLAHSNLWVRQYQAHLRDIAENSMKWTEVAKLVTKWQALIDAEVKADTKKFYPYTSFKNGVFGTVNGIAGLKPAIDGLRSAILGAFNRPRVALSAPTRTPLQPGPNEDVWVTVQAQSTAIGKVTLHWRSVGRFLPLPMFDDGKHKDGAANDGVFGVMIPFKSAGAQIDYYFSAETKAADISFLPIYTGNRPYSFRYLKPRLDSVLISEVVAKNTSGLRDNRGDYEDWIELLNSTKNRIDVGGMFLSDDRNNGKKWQIPAGISLDPGFSLIIWADDETNEGPLHANFKLSDGGEELYLSSKTGELLDYIEFGKQAADVSFGRLEDQAHSVLATFPDPTPLRKNGLYQCGTRRFSAPVPGTHTLGLKMIGHPQLTKSVSLEFRGAPSGTGYLLMIGTQPTVFTLPVEGFSMLMGKPLLNVRLPTTSTNPLSVPLKIPNDPLLDGFQLTMQALSVANGRILASNAVQMQFCK